MYSYSHSIHLGHGPWHICSSACYQVVSANIYCTVLPGCTELHNPVKLLYTCHYYYLVLLQAESAINRRASEMIESINKQKADLLKQLHHVRHQKLEPVRKNLQTNDHYIQEAQRVQVNSVSDIRQWLDYNHLLLNEAKTEAIVFSFLRCPLAFFVVRHLCMRVIYITVANCS